jgi:hypothetical protein
VTKKNHENILRVHTLTHALEFLDFVETNYRYRTSRKRKMLVAITHKETKKKPMTFSEILTTSL